MSIDTYFNHFNYKPIQNDGKNILVQLHNLKLLQIQYKGDDTYIIQEVTQGKAGERWEDISIETVILHIQMLEGGNDTFSKIWHVNDVLALDSNLSKNHVRLVLKMAMDNHDAAIIIYKSFITQYFSMLYHRICILQQALAALSNTTSNPYLSRFLSLWQFASERKPYNFLI